MNITFCGAAKEVTGSNFLVEACGKKFLVDCGLIQGRIIDEERNFEPFIYDPKEIDFMILTHAHIDHSGRIPKLYNEGFKGKVYCTKPTIELCEIMLADSGHIQEMELDWRNKKRERQGKELLKPLYTAKDGAGCVSNFEPVSYMEIFEVDENIRFRLNDAGHMLGSAIVEIWITENGKTTKIVFSGDIGNNDIPILQPPSPITTADYVVMESTYGDRLHLAHSGEEKAKMFLDIVSRTLRRGGSVIIPSFAVGRTQEILYELDTIKDKTSDEELKRQYTELMKAHVYVDSPLAISATEVYKNNMELFDDNAQERILRGDNPLEFDGLEFVKTADESKALNERTEPCVILSASGMCDAGRIKHHLKHGLWNPLNTVLFVGYQAANTLGRRIIDGEKRVKILGEEIAVNAEIQYIEGYSGHADQEWLMNFIYSFRDKPKKVFLVHGEPGAQEVLKEKIEQEIGVETIIPELGDKFHVAEYVEKLGNVRDEERVRLIREEKRGFATKVEDFEEEISILSNTVTDRMVHKHKNRENITTETDVMLLKEVLEKLDAMKKEIKNVLNETKTDSENISKIHKKVEDLEDDIDNLKA